MPRPEQLVSVTVKDTHRLAEWRTIAIEIRGRPDLFHLSDILSQAGAIDQLERLLKTANRKAIGDYVRSAKTYVKGDKKKKVGKMKGADSERRQDKSIGAKNSEVSESVQEKQAPKII